jgi:hypothetical protein
VVTEIYKPIDGYMPDAYYKQLVLAYNDTSDKNPEKNVVTFYYRKATNSAFYAVEYYLMDTDGVNYTLNAQIQSPVAVNTTATVPNINTEGFKFQYFEYRDGDETEFTRSYVESEKDNVTVGVSGALIRVYYEREKTSYTVHYYKHGTTTSLVPDKNVSDVFFGTVITEDAVLDLKGWELAGEPSQTKELLLDSSKNVFNFYYIAKQKTAKYVAMFTDPLTSDAYWGYLSLTNDTQAWDTNYNQVTAYASNDFVFLGWYNDPECTSLYSDSSTIQPVSDDDITLYALYKPVRGNLTIKKLLDKIAERDEVFVFNVDGAEAMNDHVHLQVTVTVKQGSDYAEITVSQLLIGEYTVAEDVNWSWTYDCVGDVLNTIDIIKDTTSTVEFNNAIGDETWVNGSASADNMFN